MQGTEQLEGSAEVITETGEESDPLSYTLHRPPLPNRLQFSRHHPRAELRSPLTPDSNVERAGSSSFDTVR